MNFEELYNAYFKNVYYYALSLTTNQSLAEDITQETFFSALKNLKTYEGKCTIEVWLCQIAKHKYFDLLKKDKKIEFREIRENEAVNENDFQNKFINKEEALTIHKVLHAIDEPYKEVFSLHLFAELSFKDIGEIYEKNENWARVTYYRAKLKIREVMKLRMTFRVNKLLTCFHFI